MLGSMRVASMAPRFPVQPRWALCKPSTLPRAGFDNILRSRPVAGFATAVRDNSENRSAAASAARWTTAIASAAAGVYTIDRYSLPDDASAKQPAAAADTMETQAQGGLTDVQALALGYGVFCTSMLVGWRFWRSLRPIGSYLGDVRASPHGFLHWKGGQPKMFSVDNTLGRTFLGTTSGGLLLLGAALLDGRADDDNDAAN
eukprot:COSAG02_NODE_3524_length_6615_cov_6.371393_9_plen_202_part_00